MVGGASGAVVVGASGAVDGSELVAVDEVAVEGADVEVEAEVDEDGAEEGDAGPRSVPAPAPARVDGDPSVRATIPARSATTMTAASAMVSDQLGSPAVWSVAPASTMVERA